MSWDFSNDRPIFQQIADIIVKDVVSGRYKPGEKLPPVRDLAITAGVNPNTMQKAFIEAESRGIITTRRGDGRYVSLDTQLIERISQELLHEMTRRFILSATEMGFSADEIINVVNKEI